MKEPKFRNYIYMGVTAFLVILLCILVVLMFTRWDTVREAIGTLNEILAPITYGAILAYLLSPVYNRLQRWTARGLSGITRREKSIHFFSRAIATVGSLIFLFAVISGLFSLIIPSVWSSILGIVNSIPAYAEKISGWIETALANDPTLEDTVMSLYQQGADQLISWTQSTSNWMPNVEILVSGVYTGIKGVYNFIMNSLIGVIVMVYLLNIKDTLMAQAKKIVYAVFSLRLSNLIVERCRFIHRVFGGFIIGKLIDSLIIGILTFVILNLLDMPYAMLISVIIGITNVIPFFGPFIGAIPSALLILLVSPKQCVIFLLIILLIQQFDGNILGPRILGDSTGLSSFWVLFSILFFGGIMGPLGMIIGVPTFAVIYDLVSEWVNGRLDRKHLSSDTEDYRDLDHVDVEKKTFIRQEE